MAERFDGAPSRKKRDRDPRLTFNQAEQQQLNSGKLSIVFDIPPTAAVDDRTEWILAGIHGRTAYIVDHAATFQYPDNKALMEAVMGQHTLDPRWEGVGGDKGGDRVGYGVDVDNINVKKALRNALDTAAGRPPSFTGEEDMVRAPERPTRWTPSRPGAIDLRDQVAETGFHDVESLREQVGGTTPRVRADSPRILDARRQAKQDALEEQQALIAAEEAGELEPPQVLGQPMRARVEGVRAAGDPQDTAEYLFEFQQDDLVQSPEDEAGELSPPEQIAGVFMQGQLPVRRDDGRPHTDDFLRRPMWEPSDAERAATTGDFLTRTEARLPEVDMPTLAVSPFEAGGDEYGLTELDDSYAEAVTDPNVDTEAPQPQERRPIPPPAASEAETRIRPRADVAEALGADLSGTTEVMPPHEFYGPDDLDLFGDHDGESESGDRDWGTHTNDSKRNAEQGIDLTGYAGGGYQPEAFDDQGFPVSAPRVSADSRRSAPAPLPTPEYPDERVLDPGSPTDWYSFEGGSRPQAPEPAGQIAFGEDDEWPEDELQRRIAALNAAEGADRPVPAAPPVPQPGQSRRQPSTRPATRKQGALGGWLRRFLRGED